MFTIEIPTITAVILLVAGAINLTIQILRVKEISMTRARKTETTAKPKQNRLRGWVNRILNIAPIPFAGYSLYSQYISSSPIQRGDVFDIIISSSVLTFSLIMLIIDRLKKEFNDWTLLVGDLFDLFQQYTSQRDELLGFVAIAELRTMALERILSRRGVQLSPEELSREHEVCIKTEFDTIMTIYYDMGTSVDEQAKQLVKKLWPDKDSQKSDVAATGT